MYTCIGTSDISLNLWRELSPKHKCSHICSRSCFPLCHPFHKFMQSPSSYSVLVFLLVDAIEGFLRLPLDESRRTPWLYVAPLAEVLFPRFLSFVPSLFLVSIPMPGSFLFPRFPTCRLLTSLLLSPISPYFFQFPSSAIASRVRPMRIFLSVTRHYL